MLKALHINDVWVGEIPVCHYRILHQPSVSGDRSASANAVDCRRDAGCPGQFGGLHVRAVALAALDALPASGWKFGRQAGVVSRSDVRFHSGHCRCLCKMPLNVTGACIRQIDRSTKTHNEATKPYIWADTAQAIDGKIERLSPRISV